MTVTEYVNEELRKISNKQAVCHSTLIGDVLEKYPQLKNRQLAANRINHILRLKGNVNEFKKYKAKDKHWYIIRSQQVIEEGVQNVG